MSNPVEGLLKVYEDMVEVLLVLVKSVMPKDWVHRVGHSPSLPDLIADCFESSD